MIPVRMKNLIAMKVKTENKSSLVALIIGSMSLELVFCNVRMQYTELYMHFSGMYIIYM